MSRLLTYSLSILLLLATTSSTSNNESSVRFNVTFGVKIGILPTGGLVQFAIIHYRNGRPSGMQPVSRNELVKIGIGEWPVPGTRYSFHNFFDEQGLLNTKNEDETEQPINFQAALDSLWKIRFVEHPFDKKQGQGWSQGGARPSLRQQEFIYTNYGVRGYDQDFFTDTSFFKLLRDVIDPSWIEYYKSLR